MVDDDTHSKKRRSYHLLRYAAGLPLAALWKWSMVEKESDNRRISNSRRKDDDDEVSERRCGRGHSGNASVNRMDQRTSYGAACITKSGRRRRGWRTGAVPHTRSHSSVRHFHNYRASSSWQYEKIVLGGRLEFEMKSSGASPSPPPPPRRTAVFDDIDVRRIANGFAEEEVRGPSFTAIAA